MIQTMNLKKSFLILCVLLFHLFQLNADTIILRNGQKIEGKIINQTREKVEIQKDDGSKVSIDKNNIIKIEFGPTQKQIEENKRLELEQRKKEEERKRLEEEQRKKEEELLRKQIEERLKREQEEKKRLEEERRRREEEKKRALVKSRPYEKRNGTEIGIGIGPAIITPSFFTFYQNYFENIYIFKQSTIKFTYSKETNSQLSYIKYFYNDFELGLSISLFELDKSTFKDKIRSGAGYQREQYKNVLFGFINDIKYTRYSTANFWVMYNLNQFQFFNYKTIWGLQTNFSTTQINIKQNLITFFGYKNIFDAIDYSSNASNHVSLGPYIKVYLNSKNYYTFGLLYSGGTVKFNINHFEFNNIETLYVKSSIDYYSNTINNVDFSGVYVYLERFFIISDNLNFFIKYLYNENRFNSKDFNKGRLINSLTVDDGLSIRSNTIFIPGSLQADKKRFIEKNQYFNVGISYRFNFL